LKLVWCNGRTLEVRDVGPVIFRLTADDHPLWPAGGYRIMVEEEARGLLRRLLETGLYRRERVEHHKVDGLQPLEEAPDAGR
jgi:hypothetical protein